MSPEHVSAMNERLEFAPDVIAACADLDRGYTIAYRLSGGPDDSEAFWSVKITPSGVTFGLEEARNADVTITGDHAAMIAAVKASRSGVSFEDRSVTTGATDVLDLVAPILVAASRAATLDVDFPT